MGTNWATTDEPGVDDSDQDNWTDESEPAFTDQDEWSAWLNADPASGTARRATFMGVTEAAEDFHVDPEDVNLQPEYIQDDETQWTVIFGVPTSGQAD